MEPLEELLSTVIFSAFVKDSIPTSLLLIAPSGTAKSTLIKMINGSFVHQTDSFSSSGLWQIAEKDKKNRIKFLLIPDVNPSLSRKPTTVNAAVANLLSVTYDGMVRVDDGRENKVCAHKPIGFISAVTPEIYSMHAKKFFALGLTRRIIPLFYRYSLETVGEVQNGIKKGNVLSTQPRSSNLVKQKSQNVKIPAALSNELEYLSREFAHFLGKTFSFEKSKATKKSLKVWRTQEVMPISPHLTLRTLVQANALRRGESRQIGDKDIKFIKNFLSFCDPEHPREL